MDDPLNCGKEKIENRSQESEIRKQSQVEIQTVVCKASRYVGEVVFDGQQKGRWW